MIAFLLLLLFGHRVADIWAETRKRRELNLEALHRFFDLYGEFFAVWKLWNDLAENEHQEVNVRRTRRDGLHERAAAAEGDLESFLVRLTTQFELSEDDRDVLGSFRQGYKRLRTAIGRDERLSWDSSSCDPYAAFKAFAALTAALVMDDRVSGLFPRRSGPNRDAAIAALRQVTSNQYEGAAWVRLAANTGLLDISERPPRRAAMGRE